MCDFEEVHVEYRACIESIGNRICYQSKQVFETYEDAWSYLREHIPDGYEGYVISLPKVDFNLEVDRKWE